jgi:hypothetical protein
MIMPPIDVILNAIRKMETPDKAFYKVLSVAEEMCPSKVWGRLGWDSGRDTANALGWLEAEFRKARTFTGVYLGLDTLNMGEGDGMNVDIGFSTKCDVSNLNDEDWTYSLERHGKEHLIQSLYEMKAVYENERKYGPEARDLADYVVFLAYSGIVLGNALSKLKHENPYLVKWGFHDGDMFWLAQKTDAGLTLVPGK